MRSLICLGILTVCSAVAVGTILRRLLGLDEPWDDDPTLFEVPCDVCHVAVHPARAHTHHHEPGCGDGPRVEPCPCDYYLCPRCCPCDITELLGKAS